MTAKIRFQKILGVQFFVGEAQQAINLLQNGGLAVFPSGPGMRTLAIDPAYRDALLGADLALADSGFMVLIWNLLYRPKISKLSGLKYLRALLQQDDLRRSGSTLWVMPRQESADRMLAWLRAQDIPVTPNDIYIAPQYDSCIQDSALLKCIDCKRPRHVILAVGGGVQEPLGFYLKQGLNYRPAIHCIGAAIAFLVGDQVHIPEWIDRMSLGWFWRIASNPRRFVPRYWEARRLARLIFCYGDKLPVG